MRCVVEGCRPVCALISLSEIASSREASTSISVNMRSITWIVGVWWAMLGSVFFHERQCSCGGRWF
jgi:hypothetical protein